MGANEKHAATYHGGEYTPTTAIVHSIYMTAWNSTADPVDQQEIQDKARDEFTRWLETVRAEAKAEALREAADALNPELINYRRDAMEALSQPIRPAGGDSTMSLQLALVAANRTAVWLRARA
ncbi:hypothetical protein, partial [Glutamicibacter sp. MCAF14]|uniref:hypothetical protein n=1 Tax=Glutamicibacter sp. MCAF14 TaxID=3233043 RepID=UPI003F8ECD72